MVRIFFGLLKRTVIVAVSLSLLAVGAGLLLAKM